MITKAKTSKPKAPQPAQSKSPYDREVLTRLLESIPESRWCVGLTPFVNDTHCALQHLSCTHGKQEAATALNDLFMRHLKSGAAKINDGLSPRYQQPTPRARVLAALNDLPKS